MRFSECFEVTEEQRKACRDYLRAKPSPDEIARLEQKTGICFSKAASRAELLLARFSLLATEDPAVAEILPLAQDFTMWLEKDDGTEFALSPVERREAIEIFKCEHPEAEGGNLSPTELAKAIADYRFKNIEGLIRVVQAATIQDSKTETVDISPVDEVIRELCEIIDKLRAENDTLRNAIIRIQSATGDVNDARDTAL